jgi:hypothetical protein
MLNQSRTLDSRSQIACADACGSALATENGTMQNTKHHNANKSLLYRALLRVLCMSVLYKEKASDIPRR